MYDGKLVQTKHRFEMSTILLYYDSYILPKILLRNCQITVKLLSTNLLQQTALSFLKSQTLCLDYSLTQLLNAQFNLVAHAWFGFEATQHHHQLSV